VKRGSGLRQSDKGKEGSDEDCVDALAELMGLGIFLKMSDEAMLCGPVGEDKTTVDWTW
jgi:hypothetical protein